MLAALAARSRANSKGSIWGVGGGVSSAITTGEGSVGKEAIGAALEAGVGSDCWVDDLIDEPLQAPVTSVKTADAISKIALDETGFGIGRQITAVRWFKVYRLDIFSFYSSSLNSPTQAEISYRAIA